MSQTERPASGLGTESASGGFGSFSRIISFVVLVVVIMLVSVVAYQVMAGFLLPLFLAALLVVIFRPVHRWILDQCGGRQRLAAAATTLTVMLVVLVPLGWVVTLAVTEGSEFVSKSASQNADWVHKIAAIRTTLKLDIPFATQLHAIDESLQELGAGKDGPLTPALRRKLTPHVRELQQSLISLDRELQALQTHTPTGDDKLAVQRQRAIESAEALEQLTINAASLGKYLSATEEVTGDYLELLQSCELSYRTLVQRCAGGPVLAWILTSANPSERTIEDWRARATKFLQKWLLSITGQTTAFVIRLLLGSCIMVIAIYYFLIDGPVMIRSAMRLSPLDDRYELELVGEFDRVSRAVVLATLLSAIVQGLLAGVGYYFSGLHSIFLLIVLTTVFSMIPFVGAAAGWVPACLYLALIEEHLGRAALLAAYGMIVISMADNIIKPMVLHGQSNLHPLLALLSVLGGVQAMGPIGILVGPMVMAFLQALLNMLHAEISDLEIEPAAATGATQNSGALRGILKRPMRPAAAKTKQDPVPHRSPRDEVGTEGGSDSRGKSE